MKRLNFKLIERRKTGKSLPIKISLKSRLETNPTGALKPSEGKGKYETIISYIFRLNAYNYIYVSIHKYVSMHVNYIYVSSSTRQACGSGPFVSYVGFVHKAGTTSRFGRHGSYQFLRAAGAPVRRRRGAGAPAARKN